LWGGKEWACIKWGDELRKREKSFLYTKNSGNREGGRQTTFGGELGCSEANIGGRTYILFGGFSVSRKRWRAIVLKLGVDDEEKKRKKRQFKLREEGGGK